MSKVAVETIEQLDEMRAAAIAEIEGNTVPFNEMKQMSRIYYLNRAKAVREADERAGLFVVPAEETLEMLNAAIAAEDHGGDGDTWAAKLLASPFAPKPVRESDI